MTTEMKMETRSLASLRPAEYNPRVQLQPADPEYQNIKRSIETFGYVDPIIINQDGTIIGGHQRYNVMKDLGYTEAQVVVVDLDKNNEKALNIALNKITGEWDEIKLKDLLLDLDLNDYDLTATGFSSKEVEDLVIRLDKDVEAEDDDFDADADYESIEEPVTQRGDIWILGDHRLMCGDSTDLGDVNTLMGGEEADLVITDPPYNVNYKDGSIKNDNMDEGSFEDFLQNAFLAMFENMKPGAAAYIFHADIEGLAFRRAFRDAGFKLAECLIWEKNSFVLGRQDYQWRHEPILYGWKEGAAHYFIDDRSQDTILLEDELDLESMKKEDLITYINQIIAQYKDQTTVLFEKKPTKEQIIEKWRSFRGEPQELDLPSAPKQFIQYMEEDNRPQVSLDVDFEHGMGISVGRIREDSVYDWKFVGLSHNTVRGAAGGAVLCAELLKAQGYITKK